MVRRLVAVLAVLSAVALGGCVGGTTRTDDSQSFLGIGQDIQNVFSTGTDYRSPFRIPPF